MYAKYVANSIAEYDPISSNTLRYSRVVALGVYPGDRDSAFAEEKASLSIYKLDYRYI